MAKELICYISWQTVATWLFFFLPFSIDAKREEEITKICSSDCGSLKKKKLQVISIKVQCVDISLLFIHLMYFCLFWKTWRKIRYDRRWLERWMNGWMGIKEKSKSFPEGMFRHKCLVLTHSASLLIRGMPCVMCVSVCIPLDIGFVHNRVSI